PVSLPAARLWWPSGMGKQPRYSIEVNLRTPTRRIIHPPLLYGIRFIELDTANTFTVRCNEQPLFCKGGNWIPPDSLYARATDASYDTLVREAAAANFNMLRIWGGGIYPPDSFFEACDREGILVWHDFMLACSPYPDHIESFRDEIAREADYQTRRLRNHASMALWCGSNELSYCMGAGDHLTDKGTRLLGEVLPAAVHRNCPQIPYWYTSPSGGATPDDWTAGDCHFWAVPMQSEHVKRYEPKLFDQCGALFVSEYGYPGPACRQTMSDYLIGRSSPSPIRKTPDTPDAHYDRADPLWRHHMNTFDQGAFDKGIAKHYIDPLNATLDEFIYYGGLTQGLMYGYSLESLRAKPRCHGALFWMYNDTWGEVGWTIIDYYLRRKSSFWFVRRAFAPIRLILRETGAAAAPSDGLSSTASALTSSSSVAAPSAAASSRASRARASEKIAILLANDTLNPVRATVEYGYVSTAGNYAIAGRKKFTAPPMARTTLALFPRGQHDPQAGLWFARIVPPNSSAHSIAPGSALDILPATLTDCDFRHLHITRPTLTVTARATAQREARARTHAHYITQFTVSSNIFAHSVELLLPPGVLPSDNLFDLLPGEHRTITLTTQIPRAIRAPHLTSARLLVSGCRLHRDNSFRHAARMRALPRSR
ncbi:MAG TPA: glycoside hydrolase family 2 protein, partial [Tepidisphaeraceae bacterium]